MLITVKLPEEVYKKVKARFHGHWFFRDTTFEIRMPSGIATKMFPGVEQYNPQQQSKPRVLIESAREEQQEFNTESNEDQ